MDRTDDGVEGGGDTVVDGSDSGGNAVVDESDSGDNAVEDGSDAGGDVGGDGDRLLDIAGVVLVGFLVFGVAVGTFAALGGPSDDVDAAPDADWEFERLNDSHVRVVHAGGEPLATRDLVVTSDGVRRRVSWPRTLATGDSGVVRANEGVVVRLYWTTETGERVKLATWQE